MQGEPVHDGHLRVTQDEVVGAARKVREGGSTIGHDVDRMAVALQHLGQDVGDFFFVIDDENRLRRNRYRFDVSREYGAGRFVGRRQFNDKRRAATRGAFQRQGPPVLLNEIPTQ